MELAHARQPYAQGALRLPRVIAPQPDYYSRSRVGLTTLVDGLTIYARYAAHHPECDTLRTVAAEAVRPKGR
eukprot:scaffold32784_cov69-Phaeocystis_antarctica.AAC.3